MELPLGRFVKSSPRWKLRPKPWRGCRQGHTEREDRAAPPGRFSHAVPLFRRRKYSAQSGSPCVGRQNRFPISCCTIQHYASAAAKGNGMSSQRSGSKYSRGFICQWIGGYCGRPCIGTDRLLCHICMASALTVKPDRSSRNRRETSLTPTEEDRHDLPIPAIRRETETRCWPCPYGRISTFFL